MKMNLVLFAPGLFAPARFWPFRPGPFRPGLSKTIFYVIISAIGTYLGGPPPLPPELTVQGAIWFYTFKSDNDHL